ncbi:MAG: asparagine synthase (glutamine-hydrolyzing) [Patescibacteria group bacterium]
MCGIAGKIYFDEKTRVSEEELRKMTRAIAHRGPDDEGFYIKNNVGLGNRRLAIIDLSPKGHQPMSDKNKKTWITFNGEIYNYKEIRQMLASKGVKFYSQTDTEAIIYLYQYYKENCVQYLRGMFAFAIWNEEEKKLFLARDRFGEKPIKYSLNDKMFIFGSELKAIFTDPIIKKEIDKEAIENFLNFQYCPSPMTGFKNIFKLPPGHYLILKDKKITVQRYWQPNYQPKFNQSENEIVSRTKELIREAVRYQMIADVPVGAALSGGIDSSIITGLMSQESSLPIETFSIGFNSPTDELEYARIVAKKFKTKHHEFIVKPNLIETLEKIIAAYEEPFVDSSILPTWFLAETIKPYVKVVLTGEGGDENFVGYNKYNLAKKFAFFKKINFPTQLIPLRSWRKILNPKNESDFLLHLINIFPGKLNNAAKQTMAKIFEQAETANNILEKISYFDFTSYLPDDLTTKSDIAMMAHSVESRCPFLDHKLVEYTIKIPFSLKLKNDNNKYLLEKAFQDLLPNEILNRGKQGFGLPLSFWFSQPKIVKYAKSVLTKKEFSNRKIIEKDKLKALFSDPPKNAYQIWILMLLELWFEKYF